MKAVVSSHVSTYSVLVCCNEYHPVSLVNKNTNSCAIAEPQYEMSPWHLYKNCSKN